MGIQCPIGSEFLNQINLFINNTLDNSYSDTNRYYFITANHDSIIINYLNMAAKWYLSRSHQLEIKPSWQGFVRATKKYLLGEKSIIKTSLLDSLA